MKIRLKDWPFSSGEAVLLNWIRSPFLCNQDRQWKMVAVFRRSDGSSHDVLVSWGMLPMLRVGFFYKDGCLTTKNIASLSQVVRFGRAARVEIKKNSLLIPPIHILSKEDQREHCVVIWMDNIQFVIPCLEVIRAYFAQNRMLTNELLRLDSFNGVCTAEQSNDEVTISFSKQIAITALSSEIVTRIALALFDDEFSSSWRQVWMSKTRIGANNAFLENPIEMLPPRLIGSEWKILGVKMGLTVQVLQIIDLTTPVLDLPFTKIYYDHPRFKKSQRSSGGGNEGHVKKQEGVDEVEIDTGPSAPKGLTEPRTVQIPKTKIQMGGKVSVVRVETAVPGDDSEGRGGLRVYEDSTTTGSIEVTFNDEAGVGELPSAEFTHFESLEDLPEGFNKLFDALDRIDNVDISYCAGDAPKESPLPLLPKSEGKARPYVVACISRQQKSFFLIEVDNSDSHRLSTLVFVAEGGRPIMPLINSIISKGVAVGGHWDKEGLKKIVGENSFRLNKHTNSFGESWRWSLWNSGQGLVGGT